MIASCRSFRKSGQQTTTAYLLQQYPRSQEPYSRCFHRQKWQYFEICNMYMFSNTHLD